MSSTSTIRAAATAIAVLLCAASARGDQAAAGDHCKRGTDNYGKAQQAEGLTRAGLMRAAIADYEECFRRGGTVLSLYLIARCHQALGDFCEERVWLKRYLEHPDCPADDPRTATARKRLAEIDALPSPLAVKTEPGDATVLIDGAPAGPTVPPGPHVLRVEREGSAPWEKRVTAECGRRIAETVELDCKPVPSDSNPEPPVNVVEGHKPPPPPPRRWHLGALVGAESEPRYQGFGPTLAATLRAPWPVEAGAAVTVHRQIGARATLAWFLLSGALQPFAQVGVPVFFVEGEGARAGAHAALGLHWDYSDYYGARAGAAVEYFPGMPRPFDPLAVLVTAGLAARAGVF